MVPIPVPKLLFNGSYGFNYVFVLLWMDRTTDAGSSNKRVGENNNDNEEAILTIDRQHENCVSRDK